MTGHRKRRSSMRLARRRQAQTNHAQRRAQQATEGLAVGYGALYLNQGETTDVAIAQIDTLIPQLLQTRPLERLILGLDIISTPDQIERGAAQTIARRLLAYLDKHYPGLAGRLIGITDDEARRPIRDVKHMNEDDLDGVHRLVIEN